MGAGLGSVVKASGLKIEMTATFHLPLHVKFWRQSYQSVCLHVRTCACTHMVFLAVDQKSALASYTAYESNSTIRNFCMPLPTTFQKVLRISIF